MIKYGVENSHLSIEKPDISCWDFPSERFAHAHQLVGPRVFMSFLPLDEAMASRAVFVIVSGSDGRAHGRTETLLEPAK